MAGAGQKRKRAETARMLASWPFHARSQVSQNPRDLAGCGKTSSLTQSVTSAAKAAIDFVALTARLKPRPFKTRSKSEFFRSLLEAGVGVEIVLELGVLLD